MVILPIEYSDKPVTPFGGMTLMKRFVDQKGIREHLATLDLPHGSSKGAYDPGHVSEGFWMDSIFQQIEAYPPPFAYPTAYSGLN
jgi:hypothetical protein